MTILIKKTQLAGRETDILIEGQFIKKIEPNIKFKAEKIIDGGGKAALPGLTNGHTHAAMTLLRGYADDLPLDQWLRKKIWPAEARLTPDDIYWGTKLACLEMIKSGTTCFNDMYWQPEAAIRAIEEMGLRAFVSLLMIDFDPRGQKENIARLYQKVAKNLCQRINLTIGPHAIYTVGQKNLIWAKDFANKNNLLIHLHLSETKKEVKECLVKYKLRPVEYLASFGFLGPRVILAHAVWLQEKEIKLLAKFGSSVVYNPVSNMKLASGIMPYQKLKNSGVNIILGTDGASSNNNLDLWQEMKFASLLQKISSKEPTALPAIECLKLATANAERAFGLLIGQIKQNYLADLILIDLDRAEFTPGYNLTSDLVYAASGSCVDTVICDGQILMQARVIRGEEEIMANCRRLGQKFKK